MMGKKYHMPTRTNCAVLCGIKEGNGKIRPTVAQKFEGA